MINIDTFFEFRKGVLFIRLFGILNIDTSSKYIEDVIGFIKRNKIRNININLDKVYKIDDMGIHLINKTYELVNSYKGLLMISNLNESTINIKHELNKKIEIINNELEAFV